MRECFKDVKDGYLLIYDFLSHLSHRRSIATVQTRFEKNLQDTMEAVTLSVEPSKLVRPDVFASTSSSVLLVDCQEKKKKKTYHGSNSNSIYKPKVWTSRDGVSSHIRGQPVWYFCEETSVTTLDDRVRPELPCSHATSRLKVVRSLLDGLIYLDIGEMIEGNLCRCMMWWVYSRDGVDLIGVTVDLSQAFEVVGLTTEYSYQSKISHTRPDPRDESMNLSMWVEWSAVKLITGHEWRGSLSDDEREWRGLVEVQHSYMWLNTL